RCRLRRPGRTDRGCHESTYFPVLATNRLTRSRLAMVAHTLSPEAANPQWAGTPVISTCLLVVGSMRATRSSRWSSTQRLSDVAVSAIGPGPVSMTAWTSCTCEGATLGDEETLSAEPPMPLVPQAART